MLAIVPASAHATVRQTSLHAQVADACDPANRPCFRLESTIAFTGTRDNPTASPAVALEIYLMSPDPTNPDVRRLTYNTDGDAFPALSPDGKKIVFDSNRNRAEGEAVNTSDLFQMNTDGTEQTLLTRGSSATWSPDSKNVAFHASASGTGTPIRVDPGSATTDSDIFTVSVDDLLAGVEQRRNITNSPDKIDDDADWSPDGQKIVFTSHDVGDNRIFSNTGEIYVLKADGTGTPVRLTYNNEEERGPAWSPDGARVLFSCRIGGGRADFEICVMNADGSNRIQLTDNSVGDLTATWSPDGPADLVPQAVADRRAGPPALDDERGRTDQMQLTLPPGISLLANWGELRVRDQDAAQ